MNTISDLIFTLLRVLFVFLCAASMPVRMHMPMNALPKMMDITMDEVRKKSLILDFVSF